MDFDGTKFGEVLKVFNDTSNFFRFATGRWFLSIVIKDCEILGQSIKGIKFELPFHNLLDTFDTAGFINVRLQSLFQNRKYA